MMLFSFLFYRSKGNVLHEGDSLEWLKSIESGTVDLVFADPPYNMKKADWDKLESQEKYINWSMKWIEEVAIVLKETGLLYICGFSEILADLKHPWRSCKKYKLLNLKKSRLPYFTINAFNH